MQNVVQNEGTLLLACGRFFARRLNFGMRDVANSPVPRTDTPSGRTHVEWPSEAQRSLPPRTTKCCAAVAERANPHVVTQGPVAAFEGVPDGGAVPRHLTGGVPFSSSCDLWRRLQAANRCS